MALELYQRKRKFKFTPEPRGNQAKTEKTKPSRFVIHKHQATHLHYDFRLEMDGVLKSWAVPKGLPEKRGIKRLAIAVEDHPLEYIDFQGTIPKGLYGAGKVEIWDTGIYKIIERNEKAIKFELKGKKLKGNYVLAKLKKDNQWIIYKID